MNPLYPLRTKDVAPRNQKFFKDQPQKEVGREGGKKGKKKGTNFCLANQK